MNRRFFSILASLILVLMLVGPTLTVMAAQPDSPTAATIAVKKPTSAEITAMRSMWSRDVRTATKALPAKVFQMAVPAAPSVDTITQPTAEEKIITAVGGLPDPGAEKAAKQSFAAEWAQMDAATDMTVMEAAGPVQPLGTNDVYLQYYGNYYAQHYQTIPYKAIGKLYFRTPAGATAYCSASVISGKNIIVTAGHCAYDTDLNRWNTNFVFVPAERSSIAPYGTFPYIAATVLTTWVNAPNYLAGEVYDVAVLRLNNNSAGLPVTYYTGWLGRSWVTSGSAGGYTYLQTEITYPANLSNGSLYTYISHAETFYGGAEMYAYGTAFTSGSSGAPLIRSYIPFTSGAANYVNGVHTLATTRNGFGPRFNTVNIVPLCNAVLC